MSWASDTHSHDVAQTIRFNAHAARQLPAPDESFKRADVPAAVEEVLPKFVARGIVDVVERTQHGDIYVYCTTRKAARYIAQYTTETTPAPCGQHTGVRNLGDGEFTCTGECEVRFGRETAREVLEG